MCGEVDLGQFEAHIEVALVQSQYGFERCHRTRVDGSFKGGTEGKVCRSNLRGAGYATTEITISDRQTVTWERGYNAGNRRVWGSARGGFIFNRQ